MRIEIHVHHHGASDRTVMDILETIMATLDQILADVTAESTQIDSVLALVVGLQAQIAAIPGISPAAQAQIDAIFAAAESNKGKLAGALAANTAPDKAGDTPAPITPGL